jgi:glutaconate CoA-transferase subunit B
MVGDAPASSEELQTVMASRALANDDVCFVGIGLPSAACNLARLLHAPDIVLIYESGTLQTRPDVLPLSIGDSELCETALTTVSVPEMFQYWLQGGRISKGFLGGAQVDRFANINSTVIGPYDAPVVRLPGAGGAPEIAAHCHETIITANHSPRVLVDQVDFVTTYGHGRGHGERVRKGLRTLGPTLVVTDLCQMRPDPTTSELVVTELYEGVEQSQVEAATGWMVRFADDLSEIHAPSTEELTTLRALRARTVEAHRG